MPRDEILPEILAAAGVSAQFCSRPEIWPMFEDWLREDGYAVGDETVSREFLMAAGRILLVLIQRIEMEMIQGQFRDLLSGNLPCGRSRDGAKIHHGATTLIAGRTG